MVSAGQFQRALLFEALKFKWLLAWWTSESGFFNADPGQVAGQNRYNANQSQLGIKVKPTILHSQFKTTTGNDVIAFALTNAPTSGNALIVVSAWGSNDTTGVGASIAVTDSAGNSYTSQVFARVTCVGGLYAYAGISTAPVTHGGANTVTATLSASTSPNSSEVLGVYEVAHLNSTTATATATSACFDASYATSTSDLLIFSSVGQVYNPPPATGATFSGSLDEQSVDLTAMLGHGSGTYTFPSTNQLAGCACEAAFH